MVKKTHYIAKDGRRVRHGNVRMYNRIVEFLEEKGEASTHEILDYCNNAPSKRTGRPLQHSITMQQLGNILSKYPAFVNMGTVMVEGSTSRLSDRGRYKIAVWSLLDWLEGGPEE